MSDEELKTSGPAPEASHGLIVGSTSAEDEFAFGAELMPSGAVSDAIRRQVMNDLTPVRSVAALPRVMLCGVLFAVVAFAFGVLTHGDGSHHVARSELLGTAGWTLLAFATLGACFGPFRVYTRRVQIGVALSTPLLFLVYLSAFRTTQLPFGQFIGNSLELGSALRCGLLALAFGSLTSAVVLLAWRRTDPFNPGWSGALAGLMGGLSGALSVSLSCPGREAWHLWLGHSLSVIVLALAGAALGRRVFSP